MSSAPRTDQEPSPLSRRRFLTAGLGALLAACAGTSEPRADTAAATTTSPSPPSTSPTPRPSPTASASPSPSPSASASPSPSPTSSPSPSPSPSPTASPSPIEFPTGIVPARIEIPAIGVDARCVKLQLTATEVEVPEDFDEAGWWVQTRRPGEIGPAVIGGHVDSTTGPAVFFRLDELRPGDEVTVVDDAGETRSFVVSRDPIQIDKYERPPSVFGFGRGRPELRLITCGGEFDPSIDHYTDNIVAFCHDPTYDA